MKTYTISKHNLKEFFGLFGLSQKDKDERIKKIIANDPVLKQIDANIQALNLKARKEIEKDPELLKILAAGGVKIK